MPPSTLSVTRRNSAFQVLESLVSNRVKRHRAGLFVLEGVIPITAALRHGWRFDSIVYERGAALSRWAADVVHRSEAPVRYEMSRDLLAALSGKDEPSELLAVVRMPPDDLARIPMRPDLLVALVDTPSNPGNLGTLIRSSDAFGVHGVIVTGHAVDVYDPATLTATRGSLFAVPVVRVDSAGAVGRWLASVRQAVPRCRVVGADEKAAVEVDGHDFTVPTVAVFGNETRGLSRACLDLCETTVRIPMVGSASSLNLAVAASVVFYEAARQRRRAG